MTLIFQDSDFEMEPRGFDIDSIRFTREIYYDGLTKNKLMEVLKGNFKCELYVVWKFQETFGDEPAQDILNRCTDECVLDLGKRAYGSTFSCL